MNNKHDNSIDASLLATLGDPTSLDLAANLAEVGLDRILYEGLLRDIPIINTFIGLVRLSGNVRDAFLIKKLTHFLCELNKLQEQERSQFVDKIRSDKKFRGSVGEQLLVILDRLDSCEKAELVAKAFITYLRDEISVYDFKGIVAAVEKCMIEDLIELKKKPSRASYVPEVATRLMSCGLLQQVMIPIGLGDGTQSDAVYCQTNLAKLIKNKLS